MKRFLYLDSSIIASLAVRDSEREKKIFKSIETYEHTGSSEISVVECQSGISFQYAKDSELRLYAEQNLNRIIASLSLYSVNSLVLGHARSLVKQYRSTIGLRTLDSIHLSTANLVQQSLKEDGLTMEYLTGDKRQHEAFTAEGFLGYLL
ncbi:MAG: PIN domain-containing protein [Xanthomonadaceae bacterium]|nr:PIN domain-containing protein [Xanthomonadaceae bacterium]